MNALWLHLRFSVARWTVAPLAVLGMAVLFGRNRYWIGIWPEAGAAAQVSAFFVALFAAGTAAWIAATVTVRGLQEQAATAAIRPSIIELTRFAATLIWLLVPYLAVAVTAAVCTAASVSAPGTGAFLRYTMLGILLIVLAAAWGWFVGHLLAPLVGSVCAMLSWFIGATLLGDVADATVVSGPPWLTVESGPLAIRLAAVLLFAAAVCAIPWRPGSWMRFGRGVAVSVVALGAVVAAHMATTALGPRRPAANPLCVQGTIEYCLWPEHAKYVPLVRSADERLAALPVRLALPRRVVDYSMSGSTRWVDGMEIEVAGVHDAEFDISEGSRWALARGLATAIANTVFAGCSVDARPDPEHRWDRLRAWLESRLAGGGEPDYRTNAPYEFQDAWSAGRRMAADPSQQRQAAWVSMLIAEVVASHCHAA
ncbi:hypothetical protein OHA21_16490 [Actinoplanes sp. NBC_00393]|uniref:hypothetical protein n=1 Tax=Actinoplanes sp. NBC_00393 TaxID=2975953 RepID=UPI002E21C8C1